MPLILNGNQFATGGGVGSLITVTRKPVKTDYVEGELLSLQGMQVTFYSANKDPIVIEDYTTIPAKDTALNRSDSNIIIQYKSKEGDYFQTVLPINVKFPVNIEVKNLPNRVYKKEDKINLAGLKIDLIYNDNTRTLVDNTKITSYPANGEKLGDNNSILFTYNNSGVRLECFYELGGKGGNGGVVESLITTFGTGTWDQIEQMLKASKLGKFNMQDYWKIGDERKKNVIGITFGDDLVILDFNKKISEYNNNYTVIIGNKTVSKFGSCSNIHNTDANISAQVYWKFGVYQGVNYEYFNNIIKNSELNKIVLKNTDAVPSSTYSISTALNNILHSSNPGGGSYVYVSMINEKIINTQLRIPNINDLIGDNAFKYYKTTSNRIKTNQTNQPVKYVIDDITNTHKSKYFASRYGSGDNSYGLSFSEDPIVTFGYIDTDGSYKKLDDKVLYPTHTLYYSYYFALG